MNRPFLILHAGLSENVRECVSFMEKTLSELRQQVVAAHFSNYLASHILTERNLLVCLERGAPSDEVLDFVDFLASLEKGCLKELQYSVICVERPGLSRWSDFSRQVDGLLKMLGARRLAPILQCGTDIQTRLHQWTESLSKAMISHPSRLLHRRPTPPNP